MKASETLTLTTKVVLPNDTNPSGVLFGGQLLAWIDVNASIAAARLCRRNIVTASVNNVNFVHPIFLASVVTLESKVSRAFKSSMEVITDVFVESLKTQGKVKCGEAIYTFVAMDAEGHSFPVPELIPETPEEIARYDAALRRKQLSLILAGKMKPDDATELKSLFFSTK